MSGTEKLEEKAKLLFIVSEGHSGSTLLDLICGTLPNVFSMGEMHFLSWQLKQGEVKDDPQSYCSCGKYFDKCKFWSQILREIEKDKKCDIYRFPEKIDFSINRGIIREKKYIYHRILNKLFQLGHFSRILSPINGLVYNMYKTSIENTWKLYDLVAKYSNSKYVVDSSKDINRALLLKMCRPEMVKIIILKRDVRGVASSSHEGLNEDLIKKRVKQWCKLYCEKLPVYLSQYSKDDFIEITYEFLCAEYNECRQKIADFAGLAERKVDPIDVISPYKYHTVQGNPMRLSKKDLAIKYDRRWVERLSAEQLEWIEANTNC